VSAAARGLDAQSLFDHAPCGLVVTADDGTIRLANHTFLGWVGYDAEELVDRRRVQELLTVGGRIFHQTHWMPLLRMQGSISEIKLDLIRRDSRIVPMLMNVVRREVAGDTRHEIAVFVAEDRHRYERELLAARKRAEELLNKERESQQALAAAQIELELQRAAAEDRAEFAEQMIGIVSHDLRNPITAIELSAVVIGRGELTTRQGRALTAIGNSAARCKRLIEDLLDFTAARIGGGLRVQPRAFDLRAAVEQAVDELRLLYPGRALRHAGQETGPCTADEDRLTQLLGNLVSNAMAYGDPREAVTVATLAHPDRFELAVHNRGMPIAPQALATLFEAMTRGAGDPGGERRSGHSVGLGLFIVREIARAHGGSVGVVSTADSGTTFTVTLPRRPPDSRRPTADAFTPEG